MTTDKNEDTADARRNWRRERKEYAGYWSIRSVGDLSAFDHYAKEFDEKFGYGPTVPRDPSLEAPAPEGTFEALSLANLHALVGGDISASGEEILAPGPGHSFMDRSMSVRPSSQNDEGFVVHSFSPRTSSAECRAWVNFLLDRQLRECRQRLDALEYDENGVALTPVENAPLSRSDCQSPPVAVTDKDQRIERAKWLFNRADRMPGASAYEYLRSRGLELPADLIGRVVRYERNGRWYESGGDQADKRGLLFTDSEMMLFAMRDVLTDEGRAIQMVRLPHSGKGPERKVRGLAGNAAIKLTPHEDILAAGELAVAEGFESALAAMIMGHRNVWACVNSHNIETLLVIDGVRKLTILGEHCPANEKARNQCALRWFEAGREVAIAMPDHGKDFNDDLVELALRKVGGCNG